MKKVFFMINLIFVGFLLTMGLFIMNVNSHSTFNNNSNRLKNKVETLYNQQNQINQMGEDSINYLGKISDNLYSNNSHVLMEESDNFVDKTLENMTNISNKIKSIFDIEKMGQKIKPYLPSFIVDNIYDDNWGDDIFIE